MRSEAGRGAAQRAGRRVEVQPRRREVCGLGNPAHAGAGSTTSRSYSACQLWLTARRRFELALSELVGMVARRRRVRNAPGLRIALGVYVLY